MAKKIDFYATAKLVQVGGEYIFKPMSSINLGLCHNAKVAITELHYGNYNVQFNNAPNCQFYIAIPQFTSVKKSESRNEVEEVKYLKCKMENSEYTGSSICDAINTEIEAKMPSQYRREKCRFFYNSSVDRVELSIDGSQSIEKRERVTLIIYSPLR